jgi:hypothetical protein
LTSDHVAQTLIKRKIIYVKFLRLADKSKGIPAFKKQVRGDAESIAIYDVADYHVYTFFSRRPSSFEWRFQSTEGQIDDVLQLHPFAGLTPNADLYPVPTSSTWIHSIENLATDEVFLIIPHYNSFQKGHEDVFAIIEEQIGELHMAVDFSAVTTEIEKEPYLFTDTPKAYLIGRQGRYEPVNVKTESNRIFSANVKDIKKGESLKFQWKINWNALAI